jgi:hypothetical protein
MQCDRTPHEKPFYSGFCGIRKALFLHRNTIPARRKKAARKAAAFL